MTEGTGPRGRQGRLVTATWGQLAPRGPRPDGRGSPAEASCPGWVKKPRKSISKMTKRANVWRSKTPERARSPDASANGRHAGEVAWPR